MRACGFTVAAALSGGSGHCGRSTTRAPSIPQRTRADHRGTGGREDDRHLGDHPLDDRQGRRNILTVWRRALTAPIPCVEPDGKIP